MLQDLNSQVSTEQMDVESAKAALGVATYLQDQLIPKAPEIGQPGAENGDMAQEKPEMAENTQMPEMEQKMAEMEAKMQEMEKSMKDTIRAEIGGIKDMIKQALEEDGEE